MSEPAEDPFASLPDALRARLDAAGVTDHATLQAALTDDPDLVTAFQTALLDPFFAAFAATESTDDRVAFWRAVPVELEEPFLAALADHVTDREARGDAAAPVWRERFDDLLHVIESFRTPGIQLTPELRARLDAAGVTDQATLQAALADDPGLAADLEAHQASAVHAALIQQLLATESQEQLATFWQSVPSELEESFLAAAGQVARDATACGDSALSTRLRARLAPLQAAFDASASQRRTAEALRAFVQAPTDLAATDLFAAQRVLLKPYDAQRMLDTWVTSATDEHRNRLTERAALLRHLRDAAPQSAQPSTLQPPFPASAVTDVTGDLYQATGNIYVNAQHVEAGGVLVNNVRLERRWLMPTPPPLHADLITRSAEQEKVTTLLRERRTVALGSINRTSQTGIQGMTGVGKTTLAQQISFACADEYPDGVLFQSIGPDIRRPEQAQAILDQWARYALIVPPQLGVSFSADAVRSLLATHPRLLVVLDDVWEVGAIRPLRDALHPGAQLLVTSRATSVLNSLGGGSYQLGLLHTDDAIELVGLRLSAHWPTFAQHPERPPAERLPPSEQTWVNALIAGVGHHPLALDIAARLIADDGHTMARRTAVAHEIITHIATGDDFNQLVLADGDREQSVEQVLSFSYHRLDAQLQSRFRSLGSSASEATTDLAAFMALWRCDESDARRTLNRLAQLALISITVVQQSGEDHERWGQHALLRGLRTGVTATGRGTRGSRRPPRTVLSGADAACS